MGAMASQITSLTIVYITVYSGVDQRNIKAPRQCPLCGEFTGDRWFSAQRASNAENLSIWWHHHKCFGDISLLAPWNINKTCRPGCRTFGTRFNLVLLYMCTWRVHQTPWDPIVSSYKSHNASNIPLCTILQQKRAHMHISVLKWCIVGYGTVELWHFWTRSIIDITSYAMTETHIIDGILVLWRLKSPVTRLLVQKLIQSYKKVKTLHSWPFGSR